MIPNIETIFLRQMASGDRLFLQVYQFKGAKAGKKVYIQSNLHGAEISGNAVIHQLIEFLLSLNDTDLAGEIWLVPVCNPMGVNERWRGAPAGSDRTFFLLVDTVLLKLETGIASFGTMKKKLMI